MRIPLLICAATFALAVASCTPAGPAAPVRPQTTIEEVTGWLPENTQTLMVAQDFTVEYPEEDEDQDDQFPPLLFMLRAAPAFAVGGVGDGVLLKRLSGRKLTFALQGARNFRSPTRLGSMLYAGCQFLSFERPLAADFVPDQVRKAGTALRIEGNDVLHFKEKLEEDLWSFYIVQPRPNLLLCATDEDYLREVLARMRTPAGKRAFPRTLPEWRHIDLCAPFWALRHYDPSDAALDPSSPFLEQAPANNPDPDAIGLAFSARPDEASRTVHYFTRSPNGPAIARRGWHLVNDGLTADTSFIEKDTVAVCIKSASARADWYFVLLLLAALGQAVYF